MRSILQDLRYAVRQLRKSPGFTIAAIAVLALGIGANIAVFTVLNGILLRPLPYAHSDRILKVELVGPMPYFVMTYANMLQLRDAGGHGLQMGAALGGSMASIVGPGGRLQVERTDVDANLFPMLGVQPILGRVFRPEETDPGRNHVVLMGEDVWRKLYNSDAQIVGKTLSIRGSAYTILGVMPRDFAFPVGEDSLQIWSPAEIPPAARSAMSGAAAKFPYSVYARLPEGLTQAQLADQFNRAQAVIAKEVPKDDDWPTRVKISGYEESLNAQARRPLFLLAGVVFGIWALACLNVTSLMLARAVSRVREQAVRSALGASRMRLLQQSVVESLLLSGIGALAGMLVGQAVIKMLWRQITRNLPLTSAIHVDWRVMAALAVLTLVTACITGIIPALRAIAPQCAGVAARRYEHCVDRSESDARGSGGRAAGPHSRLSCGSGAVSAHHSCAAAGAAGLLSTECPNRRSHPERLIERGTERSVDADQHCSHVVSAAAGASARHPRRAGGGAQFRASAAQGDERQHRRGTGSARIPRGKSRRWPMAAWPLPA